MTSSQCMLFVAVATAAATAAACPEPYFKLAQLDGAAALQAEFAPRMAYLPLEVLEDAEREQHIAHLCERVAQALLRAASEPAQFVMASEDGETGIVLLRCVAAATGNAPLPRLELAFVGNPDHELEARTLVEGWGATFRFVSDRDYRSVEADMSECAPS